MKKIFVLLAAMAMTLGANAQIVESKSKVVRYEEAKPKSGYNRIMFNYSPVFTGIKVDGVKAEGDGVGKTLQGGGMSYTRGIAVSKKLPMFIEVGLGVQFNSGNVIESNIYGSSSPVLGLTLVRANIPVAFTYRFALDRNKQFKISPFTGFNFGFNIVTSDDKNNYSALRRYNYSDNNYNLFQMGWLIGANFTFKRFNLQIAYTLDFMPLYKQDAQVVSSYIDVDYGYGFGERFDTSYDVPEIKASSGTLIVGLGWEF